MQAYQISEAVSGLKTVLERAKRQVQRFEANPIRALGIFAEGPDHGSRDLLCHPRHASRYLEIPIDRIVLAEGTVHANRDTTHEGPYFLFLRDGESGGARSAEQEIRNQLDALGQLVRPVLDYVEGLPGTVAARFRRAGRRNWMEILFDLATHYPSPFLSADRRRWINVTGPAPDEDGPATLTMKYPYSLKLDELGVQLRSRRSRSADVIPGTIWSELQHDVFSSTGQVIELLTAELETSIQQPAVTDPVAVRRRFAELHGYFSQIARIKGGVEHPEWRLVKLTSSFRTDAAGTWCDFPIDRPFEHLRLSQRHADAEYLLCRPMEDDLRALLEEAGHALPLEIPDGPVMFHRNLGEFVLSSGAHLDPNPVAKWIRFVFNTLREKASSSDEVCFHYEGAGEGALSPFSDVYGFATLKNGFFAASATAIELAALLPQPVMPPSGLASQASETGAGAPPLATANSPPLAPTKPAKRSTTNGEARERLIAALTKHHRYADGSCMNFEPIGNNELARRASVDGATASKFFKDEFKSHAKYKVQCLNTSTLIAMLKLLNGEFAPYHLYGQHPDGEEDRGDE